MTDRERKLLSNLAEIQSHRDAWRGYAYGDRGKPDDYLDGNRINRPETLIERLGGEIKMRMARGFRRHNL